MADGCPSHGSRVTRWLREQCEERGLTMRDLGVRLGMPHTYVQKVELGERRLDVVEYVWYCKALGVEPQDGVERVEHSVDAMVSSADLVPLS